MDGILLQKRRRAPKKDSSDSTVGFERLTNNASTARDAKDAKDAKERQ
jgi:hypothetical protein